MKPRLLLIPIIAITLSCTTKRDNNLSSRSAAIDELYQQFSRAYRTLDVELVSNLYARDARYLPSNPERSILAGRAPIQNTFSSYFEWAEANGRDLDIQFRIVKRKISDSLAFDTGYYLIRSKVSSAEKFPGDGGNVGKFVTVAGLNSDGTWKFLVDGFSPAPYEAFLDDTTAHNPVRIDDQ